MALPFYNQGDQDIYAGGDHFVPQEQYRLNYTPSQKLASTIGNTGGVTGAQAANPYIWPPQGGGGGGNNLNALGAYTGRTYNPDKLITNRGLSGGYIQGTEPKESFIDKFGNKIAQGITKFLPDMAGGFLSAGMGLLSRMDKFDTLSPVDQEFIKRQMANQEQSVHGGNLANQDKYGYNKRSFLGNYGELVTKRADIARARGDDLRDIDRYYLDKEEEQNKNREEMRFNDIIRRRNTAKNLRKNPKNLRYDGTDIHGGTTTKTTKTTDGNGGGTGSPDGGAQAAGDLAGGSALHSPFAQGGRIGMAKGKIPIPKAKTKMGFGDKLWGGIAGLSTLIKHPNLYKGFEKRTESGLRNIRDLRAARIAKYGKWGMRGTRAGMSLMNPWTAVPFALGYGAKYAVGKAFDPYRDETGKIGAEGHERLLQERLAREALMAQRNAARQNRRDGGLAGIL